MKKEKTIKKLDETEFLHAAEQYATLKDEVKAQNETITELSDSIKLYMTVNEINEFVGTNTILTLRNTETDKYNEVLLLQYLKEGGFSNCIKTKEYVDMNELEKHIYAGVLDEQVLKKFKDVEYKQALYYKRK